MSPPTWFCYHCNRKLEPAEVTYDERHDERAGGCGNPVGLTAPLPSSPATPPVEPWAADLEDQWTRYRKILVNLSGGWSKGERVSFRDGYRAGIAWAAKE